jgi:integrase
MKRTWAMPEKLTDKLAKEAPSPTGPRLNAITYDNEVKGFGLRVTRGGDRAFVLNYRIAGRERRLTIGSYPDWTVVAARNEAKRLKREIDLGRDPLAERIAIRESPTVADLADRFLAEHGPRKRERSRLEDEGLIRQWIRPELGRMKVADIRHADVDALHRKITGRGTLTRANRTVALVSRMFTLAIRWEWRPDNPAAGIERNYEQPRQRYLVGDELRRLTDALSVHPNQQAADAIRLLLLTGARRSEVLAATWDQFDLGDGVWIKPSSHTKQKREHRVPLSAPARQLLAKIKAAVEQRAVETGRASPFVFPARTGPGHMIELKTAWATICRVAQLDGVRVHDLRHSYASILASAGLSLPVIGALLGHTQPGTTARYSHLFDDPLRAATERVGAVVTSAAGDKPPAEVIAIKSH